MTDAIDRNRQAQREAYGEPLGDAFRRVMDAFTLTQAGLARVLGMSPPMLSQLISAQRVKIGNPAVLHRLSALEELAEAVRAGRVPGEQVVERLEEIRGARGQWTRTDAHLSGGDEAVVEGVRQLLRAVASGQDLTAAADLLKPDHPGISEVLRVYGTGPAAPAVEHFARHRHLF